MKYDLQKLFEGQAKLDQKIWEVHGLQAQDKKDINRKALVALIVELAEFANEISFFKYWKKQINVNLDKVLEEYADGLHFFISYSIYKKLNTNLSANVSEDKNLSTQFLVTIKHLSDFFESDEAQDLEKAFEYYLGFIELLELDANIIFASYFKKLEINFQRIANNY